MKERNTVSTVGPAMWDKRYSGPGYAYGKEPNEFFKEWLQKFSTGTILLPAEGEGRNGVYAATLGWQVTAFDISTAGKGKALQLAQENNVRLEYHVGDVDTLVFGKDSFDAIGLIYAHFDAGKKFLYHRKIKKYLKPGGIVIFEGFSKEHLQYNTANPEVGGPKDIGMLFVRRK